MDKKYFSYISLLFLGIILCIIASFVFLKPSIRGDGVTYMDSIHFLQTGEKTPDFFPNRLITTMAPMQIIIFFGGLVGSQSIVWIVMNVLFYVIACIFYYELLLNFFDDRKVAFVGTLFLITNYATTHFGLNYLMDMGGWMFYIITLFYMHQYALYARRADLLRASLSVGIGGMFKEYALLGVIPIGLFLIYENRTSLVNLFKKSYVPACISVIPILSVYVYVYTQFQYTYADWIKNSYQYFYSSSFMLRIAEYIKSFGSLYNILGIFVFAGFVVFVKEYKNIEPRIRFFVVASIVSFLPVFLWGGVTQRILFITVPASLLVATFFFKKYEQYIYWITPLFICYVIINFLMDSFILKLVNLPF